MGIIAEIRAGVVRSAGVDTRPDALVQRAVLDPLLPVMRWKRKRTIGNGTKVQWRPFSITRNIHGR
jgi:hypothetical protein